MLGAEVMMPSEMKEYCNTLSSFDIKVSVRLKAETKHIVGKILSTDSRHFLLKTENNEAIEIKI